MFSLIFCHVLLVLFSVSMIVGCGLIARGVIYSKILSLVLGILTVWQSQYMISEMVIVINELS
jgi:hypothetical protein